MNPLDCLKLYEDADFYDTETSAPGTVGRASAGSPLAADRLEPIRPCASAGPMGSVSGNVPSQLNF